MNKLVSIVCGIGAVVFALSSTSAKDESPHTRTIPLDEVFSLGMSGTKDIHALEKDGSVGKTCVDEIVDSLIKIGDASKSKHAVARAGFAVEGEGPIALRKTHAILVDGEKPRQSFASDKELTLVFFSYLASDVQIKDVEVQGHKIDIHYRFVTYLERNLSMQLALIPVGKLNAGIYEVRMSQSPAVQRVKNDQFTELKPPRLIKKANELISQPFSFEVLSSKE